MNRKEITRFLSELLVKKRLSGMGKYYASEVTMDWYIGKITHTMRRVDFIQFVPKNQTVSGIEHGDFYFYEVKSCKEDYNSGNGLTFEGDKNYIITTAETYKKIIKDVSSSIKSLVLFAHTHTTSLPPFSLARSCVFSYRLFPAL